MCIGPTGDTSVCFTEMCLHTHLYSKAHDYFHWYSVNVYPSDYGYSDLTFTNHMSAAKQKKMEESCIHKSETWESTIWCFF